MQIRKIKDSEREEILLGDRYAYGNWQEQSVNPSSSDNILDTIIPNQTLGCFIQGKIVAALRIHRFQQSLRGVIKEMGGIGGVWTYPEYRNQGCVKELIHVAFRLMQAQGQGLSMLIPFRQSFYQKFGYVTANSNLEVRVPIASIISDFTDNFSTWEYERVSAPSVQTELLEFLKHTTLNHGEVIPSYWQQAQWQDVTKDRQCVLVKQQGKILAVGIYRINSTIIERKIYLDHYFYTDIESRIRLFSFFAKHRDQINDLYLDVPFGTNFQQWFGDVMSGYEITIKTPPYMVRVIDLVAAIHNLPVHDHGAINIQIDDSPQDWHSHVFSIEAVNYLLNVKPSSLVKPEFKFTIQGISALVYGTMSLAELEYRNWLEVVNHDKRSLLESWFPPLALYNTWKF
ncbi:putative acetyltransferase [Synechococcus sp. PCC 7502]|uniref:GNAT family N-acetyltransferase n=1 Tax=Synechococcus sp. PCC 7502 TaxID=1173263 RepID=UPI00029FDB6A|nr:GNAT family N-acetyltransferase [Synechococcus sp. PCC 7502]AFY73782.1 putative acetyltransferase [Synechococcus sp. PCC 7502]